MTDSSSPPTPKRLAQFGYHIALIAGVVTAIANPGTEVNVPSNPDIVRRVVALEASAASPRTADQISALRQEVSALRATLDLLIRFDGRLASPLRAPVSREGGGK